MSLINAYSYCLNSACHEQKDVAFRSNIEYSPRWSSIKCSGDKTSLMARRSCFILHFKSSFLISKSKFHHKIVLLFKYRDKSFYKLFEGKNISKRLLSSCAYTNLHIFPPKLYIISLFLISVFVQHQRQVLINNVSCSF